MKKVLLFVTVALLILLNIRSWAAPCCVKDSVSSYMQVGKAQLEQEAKQALEVFKGSRSFGEQALIDALNLICKEKKIVDMVWSGCRGTAFDRALRKRNKMVRYSLPSSVMLYTKIVDYATADERLFPEYRKKIYSKPQQQNELALTRDDKRDYLRRMHIALSEYEMKLKELLRSTTGMALAESMVDGCGRCVSRKHCSYLPCVK